MSKKFWIWLREYANKKVRSYYEGGLDLKCSHCLTWTSEGYPLKNLISNGQTETTTCGKCNKQTNWVNYGIVWSWVED